MLFGIRRELGTLGLLLIILSSLAVSACGGGTQSGGGSSATTIITATAPVSGSGPGTYLVSWNPVADSRVTGYKLYYSTTPLDQGGAQALQVGDSTSYTFDPIAAGIGLGATVYVAVAAVGSGAESAMSTPVSVVIQ